MNRALLAALALLAAVAVFVAVAPPIYHRLFCPLCRGMRALRRAR